MAPKKVKLGNNERMSFSKIDEILEMPNLITIQKDSYNWFLEKGLKIQKTFTGQLLFAVVFFIDLYSANAKHLPIKVLEGS